MILLFKPFKAGDYITALGYSGIVSEVNIVSTRLRTFDNRTIILPNGALSNGNIDNYLSIALTVWSGKSDWIIVQITRRPRLQCMKS